MGGGHAHGSAGMRNRRTLVFALCLGLSVVAVQLVGAFLANSLALLADAAHMFTDVAGIALAIVAISIAARSTRPSRTFGLYRIEILATVANGFLLLGMSIYILTEAVQRWNHPEPVKPAVMIGAALYGVAANVTSMVILRRGSKESLAVKGAYLEVLSDALGSFGVVIAGLVVLATGFDRADVVVSVVIALFMVPRTLLLLRDAFGVLMENAPRGLDPGLVRAELAGVPGVESVHDLHIWAITSGMPSLSAHVVVTPACFDAERQPHVLAELQRTLYESFDIEHSTLQIELPEHREGESSQHP